MTTDVYTEIKQFVLDLINGDKAKAFQFAGDQDGTLTAQGITDGDLSQIDMQQLVGECIAGADLPEGTRQALQSYVNGSPPSYPVSTPPPYSASQSAADVVQHLNYVTYATYEGDEEITQQLINYQDYSTNIDNSVDVDVDGDVHGDFEVDTTNVNATGDGAVAAGDDVENAITGDGNQNIDGDNYGTATNNAVTGDGNQVANIDLAGGGGGGLVPRLVGGEGGVPGATPININFGGGTQQNIQGSTVEDSAIGGDDASNMTDNYLYEGASAAVGGGDATSDYQETYVQAQDSNVSTEQGEGYQDTHQDLTQTAEATEEETEDAGSM
jgi:hypothetical protein